MKQLPLLALVAFAAPAFAAVPAPAPSDQTPTVQKEIVVTGTSLSQTRRNLEQCLSRHCPPNEDIDATLAHAENLFVSGDYAEARRVTHASIGRNARHGKQYPIDVSDLYRATGRIASHMGEGGDYERSTTAMNRVLTAALPNTDIRRIGGDLEVADMYESMGRSDRARQMYEQVERNARAIGRTDVAGTAMVRAAWVNVLDGQTWLARQELRKIAADRSPGSRVGRTTALLLLARLDRKEGKTASSDALINELRTVKAVRPVLIYSPPITLKMAGGEPESGSVTRLMAMDTFEGRWVDVGFWVTPEGKVTDPEILRSSGTTSWSDELMRSIAGRVYMPLSNPDGAYRVERYSYTSLWEARSGTRVRQRSANARIEYVDLTADPAPPAPAPGTAPAPASAR
jgi:hypothetical protein